MSAPLSGTSPVAQPAAAASSAGRSPQTPLTREQQKLRTACVELEGFLWGFVFRPSSLAADHRKGPFQEGSGTQSFREMLDSERARQTAKSGGSGLADALYRELSRKMQDAGGGPK